MTPAEQLTLILRLTGLTQDALAKRLGVSFPALNAWVRGRSMPRAAARRRIAALLKELGAAGGSENTLEAIKKLLKQRSSVGHGKIMMTILNRPDVRDELTLALTYHSNVIEGSTLTKGETAAVLFENAVLQNRTLREQMEAKNHQAAVEYLWQRVRPRMSIDEPFILKLHASLMNGIQSDSGVYRRHAVRIVGANVPTANPASLPRLMQAFIAEINRPTPDVVASAARMHARFELIHPFTDGNGRVGRLLLQVMLLRKNYAPAVIEQLQKREYLKRLNAAQLRDDLEPFEQFICEAVLVGYAIINRKRGA